ncbi:MAG: hypothetical protein JOZ56_07315 [Actinobacteria bacterium]|nr:hypothetical protein [Actinomycetota bacterium]
MAEDSVELARSEWEDAHRRLEAERVDRALYRRRLAQIDLVSDGLRRHVGGTYSLADLVRAYGEAERWARELIEERAPGPGWPRDLALVVGAAFHAYQRGALDYTP